MALEIQEKQWTVGELKHALSELDDNIKVRLEDADTGWTILEFGLLLHHGKLWFQPSDYHKMSSDPEAD